MDLDLRRLRYVITVADELHFGRAAERLHIAQPALSQQIKAFEESLGVRVFTRTTRSVSLTPVGERLVERTRRILAEADATVAEVQRMARGEEGTLRLGFIGSASYGLMPTVTRTMRERYPRIMIELTSERLSGELARAVHAGTLDAAVLRPNSALEGLRSVTLAREPLVMALPKEHPLAESDAVELPAVAKEPFVSFPAQVSAIWSAQREACLEAGFEPTIAAEVSETSTLVAFVAAGLGVALVPRGVEQVRLPGVAYRPLAGQERTIPLVLAWRAGSEDSLLRHSIEVIAGLVAQLPGDDRGGRE